MGIISSNVHDFEVENGRLFGIAFGSWLINTFERVKELFHLMVGSAGLITWIPDQQGVEARPTEEDDSSQDLRYRVERTDSLQLLPTRHRIKIICVCLHREAFQHGEPVFIDA